jgi:hypothetical protein
VSLAFSLSQLRPVSLKMPPTSGGVVLRVMLRAVARYSVVVRNRLQLWLLSCLLMVMDDYGWLWSWSFFWFWLHVPAARTTFRQWVCTTAAPTAVLGVWRELVLLPHAVVCVAHVTVALVPLTRSPVRRQQRKHMHVIPIEALCVLHPCVVDTGNTVAVRASGVRLAVASLLSRMRC